MLTSSFLSVRVNNILSNNWNMIRPHTRRSRVIPQAGGTGEEKMSNSKDSTTVRGYDPTGGKYKPPMQKACGPDDLEPEAFWQPVPQPKSPPHDPENVVTDAPPEDHENI